MTAKNLRLAFLLTLAVSAFVFGQGALIPQQKPSPEYQKLGGLVGNWVSEGAGVDSPLGPAETQSLTI